MAHGYAVCVGLNSVDPKHYQGWSGHLLACEADANDMADIAKTEKFDNVTLLLTADATRKKVRAAIEAAAKSAHEGDLVLLTYSGHGGQLPDKNGDEPDGSDETWCLFDGEHVDDELYDLFTHFRPKVRVLVLSDSCHSGTVTREAVRDAALRTGTLRATSETRSAPAVAIDPTAKRFRAMPDDVALATYRANKAYYDEIIKNLPTPKQSARKLQATVRLISGCQDNQLSQDGAFNGLFTGTLLRVWKHGTFKGDYELFHKKIRQRMPSDQTPNHFVIGPPNHDYDDQKPFVVD
jgi:hypothetical protein